MSDEGAISGSSGYNFDVAISFAGTDREIARELHAALVNRGLSVFYDEKFQERLWGQDLVIEFEQVFSTESRYCVILVSADYVRSEWTRHELSSALARRLRQTDYVLQVKLDDTALPGIPSSVAYVRAADFDAISELADIIYRKVHPQEIVARIIKESRDGSIGSHDVLISRLQDLLPHRSFVLMPAGAASTLDIGATPNDVPGRWILDSVPPEMEVELYRGIYPSSRSVTVRSACRTRPGLYNIGLTYVDDNDHRTSGMISIAIHGRLTPFLGGQFRLSSSEETISARRGGPSTLTYGPYIVMQFCREQTSQRLHIKADSARDERGDTTSSPPSLSLFRLDEWPVPTELWTATGGAYRHNAKVEWECRQHDIDWQITDGAYILALMITPGLPADAPTQVHQVELSIGIS